MSMIKKSLTGFAIASLVLASSAPATNASELSEKVNVNSNAGTSKHFDPAHIGHSHKCNNCQQSYNQQGDNGQYSQGSNICPHCGFANPMPNMPSPATYTPPAPVPPQYPNYPSQPNYGVSIDALLMAWDAASSYEVADNILLNAVNQIYSLRDLFRLVAKVHYFTSEAAIVNSMERSGIICDVTVDDVCRCWDSISQYDSADKMLLISARYFSRDVGAITAFMKKCFYRTTEQALANMIPYAASGGYQGGYRSEVRSRINSELISGETKSISTKSQISNEQIKILETAKSQLANYKEVKINLTETDIEKMDIAKIKEFTGNLKKGAYKKSEKLFSLKKDLAKKLKMAAMDNAEVSEILKDLK